MSKPLSKKDIRAIRQRLEITLRLTTTAQQPDASAEAIIMCAAAHAMLALEVVPMRLDEVERLQSTSTAPTTSFVKFSSHGGNA